jgi:hypothetical protein
MVSSCAETGLISGLEGQVPGTIYAKLYGPIWRVRLKTWLYTLPDPVQGVEITSVLLVDKTIFSCF